jgi:hypothetical protein
LISVIYLFPVSLCITFVGLYSSRFLLHLHVITCFYRGIISVFVLLSFNILPPSVHPHFPTTRTEFQSPFLCLPLFSLPICLAFIVFPGGHRTLPSRIRCLSSSQSLPTKAAATVSIPYCIELADLISVRRGTPLLFMCTPHPILRPRSTIVRMIFHR